MFQCVPRRLLDLASIIGVGLMVGGCEGERQPSFGDYAHNVQERDVSPKDLGIAGTVLLPNPSELVAIDIATKKSRTLFSTGEAWSMQACAGPNCNGLVAFIDNNMDAKRHRLHVLDTTSGKHRIIFERKGDALWEDAISENMAIAGKANIAALLVGVGHEQLRSPDAYMSTCNIELVDLVTGRTRRFTFLAYGETIAIDDTAKNVFFIGGLGRKEAARLPLSREIKQTPGGSDPTPVAFRLDTTTGETFPLHPAWRLSLSNNGNVLGLCDYDGKVTVYDLIKHTIHPFPSPDYIIGAINLVSSNVLVARAKPASLKDVQMTKYNGLPGPRPMSRVLVLDTAKHQIATVYNGVDPRTAVTFSPWPIARHK